MAAFSRFLVFVFSVFLEFSRATLTFYLLGPPKLEAI